MADEPPNGLGVGEKPPTQTHTDATVLDDGTYVRVANDRPDTVDVIPGIPRPEFPPTAGPVAQLWPLGDLWQVQTGFQWTIDEEDLRRQLPTLFNGRISGGRTVIRFAVSGVPRVTLQTLSTDSPATSTVVAETDSSGFPPYTAIMSIRAGAELAGAVQAALAGATGRTVVTYHADLLPDIDIPDPLVAEAANLGIHYAPNPQRTNGFTVTAQADLARLARTEHIEKGEPQC